MCIGLHVKCPLFLPDFNETRIFSTVLRKKKYTSTEFHKDPSSGSRVVPSGQKDGTDLTKPKSRLKTNYEQAIFINVWFVGIRVNYPLF